MHSSLHAQSNIQQTTLTFILFDGTPAGSQKAESINNPLTHFLCSISINKEDSHSYFLLRVTLETTLELTFWLKRSDFFHCSGLCSVSFRSNSLSCQWHSENKWSVREMLWSKHCYSCSTLKRKPVLGVRGQGSASVWFLACVEI